MAVQAVTESRKNANGRPISGKEMLGGLGTSALGRMREIKLKREGGSAHGHKHTVCILGRESNRKGLAEMN